MGTGGFFEVTAGILSAQIKVTYVNLPQNPEKCSFFMKIRNKGCSFLKNIKGMASRPAAETHAFVYLIDTILFLVSEHLVAMLRSADWLATYYVITPKSRCLSVIPPKSLS